MSGVNPDSRVVMANYVCMYVCIWDTLQKFMENSYVRVFNNRIGFLFIVLAAAIKDTLSGA